MTTTPIYIDATMLLRWRHLAPVGIVRTERLIAAHLRLSSSLDKATYVVWEAGYRPATPTEESLLDELLGPTSDSDAEIPDIDDEVTPARTRSRALPAIRRAAFKPIAYLPQPIRPYAEQAAWSTATLAVESARQVRRARQRRRVAGQSSPVAVHLVDFSQGADLVVQGLGWDYLDYEAMYLLASEHGVRVHLGAFDLIPVDMPQMNFANSGNVHRYYAEMAHFADTVTCNSETTKARLRRFFADESLLEPYLVANTLPGFDRPKRAVNERVGIRPHRHRLEGQEYVLTVSTVEVRKNHLLLAKLWAECAREGIQLPQLAIVGRIGWDVNEVVRWIDWAPELDTAVTIYSDVEDDELIAMYEDALFTVFPSRVEGWGLPITEALSFGKVCIHSDDPAQLEASQGLMPALHPDDFPGWKREVARVAHDAPYRAQLERRIQTEYRLRTAEDYCATFETMLIERRGANA